MVSDQFKERPDFVEPRAFHHFMSVWVPVDEPCLFQSREMSVVEFYLKGL